MAAPGTPTTEPDAPAVSRRAVLKGATATVCLRLLTSGLARAGAGSLGTASARRVATFLAVERQGSDQAIDVLRGLELWASVSPAASQDDLLVGSGPADPDAVRVWYDRATSEADVLVAPYGSPLARIAFEVAEARHVPCVAPSAGDSDLWSAPRQWSVDLLEPTPSFFDGALALAAGRARAPVAGVALVYRDDPYSASVMAGAARRARALGFDHIVHHRFRDARQRDAAARAARAGTVLGIGYQPGTAGEGFLDDAVGLARALPRARDGVVAIGVGAADPAFGAVAGAAAEGVVGVTGWRPYLPTPGNAAFVAAFADRWHREPTAHAAQGYAAGQVVARAFRLADHTTARLEPTTGPARHDAGPGARRYAVRDALHALDIETVFGRYRVDASGRQSGHRPALVVWSGGRLQLVDRGRPDTLSPAALPHRSAP